MRSYLQMVKRVAEPQPYQRLRKASPADER